MKSRGKKLLSFLFFGVGLVLLILLINKVGLQEVLGTLAQLKYKIIYVFLFPITWYSLQSYAWWRVLTFDGDKVPYHHVLLSKLTGEAINTVTPVNFIGGDPYRVYLLQKKASLTKSTASVVIDRTMYMLAVVLLLLVTLVVALIWLPMPTQWKTVMFAAIILFFTGFFFLVRFQKKGMFISLSNLVQKFGIKKDGLKALEEKIKSLDEQVGGFYRKSHWHFFEIMVLQFIGRFLGVIEIYMIVSLLGLPVSFVNCFFLASLTILINIVFVFIPGSMGVMESGYGALFYMLKLNPAYGVAIQLIRRIRTFFWIGVGLLIILLYKPQKNEA